MRFIRHALHINLAPGFQQEVQFSYERTFSSASALEVVLGARISSPEQYDYGINHMIVGGYDARAFTLSYENAFSAGLFWKGSLSPSKRRGFIPFVAPGILYRYGFFNNKFYGESSMAHEESFSQEFSLRKHEVTTRLQLGIRRHFYLRGGKSALSAEASLGFGGGKRFGKFLDVRRFYGWPPIAEPGRPIEAVTNRFNVNILVFPVSVKIGYSWGG